MKIIILWPTDWIFYRLCPCNVWSVIIPCYTLSLYVSCISYIHRVCYHFSQVLTNWIGTITNCQLCRHVYDGPLDMLSIENGKWYILFLLLTRYMYMYMLSEISVRRWYMLQRLNRSFNNNNILTIIVYCCYGLESSVT